MLVLEDVHVFLASEFYAPLNEGGNFPVRGGFATNPGQVDPARGVTFCFLSLGLGGPGGVID